MESLLSACLLAASLMTLAQANPVPEPGHYNDKQSRYSFTLTSHGEIHNLEALQSPAVVIAHQAAKLEKGHVFKFNYHKGPLQYEGHGEWTGPETCHFEITIHAPRFSPRGATIVTTMHRQ